jgi:hypothetical protein
MVIPVIIWIDNMIIDARKHAKNTSNNLKPFILGKNFSTYARD